MKAGPSSYARPSNTRPRGETKQANGFNLKYSSNI